MQRFNDTLDRLGRDKFVCFDCWGTVFDLREAVLARSFAKTTAAEIGEEERTADEANDEKVVGSLNETVCLARLKQSSAEDI